MTTTWPVRFGSSTVCANENSASRLPSTGNTSRAASTRAKPWRRHEPVRDRLAQRGRPDGHGIMRDRLGGRRERVEQQLRRRVPRLADRQVDRRERRVGLDAGEPLPQALERVGLQQRQAGIHEAGIPGRTGRDGTQIIRQRAGRPGRRPTRRAAGACRRVARRRSPPRRCSRSSSRTGSGASPLRRRWRPPPPALADGSAALLAAAPLFGGAASVAAADRGAPLSAASAAGRLRAPRRDRRPRRQRPGALPSRRPRAGARRRRAGREPGRAPRCGVRRPGAHVGPGRDAGDPAAPAGATGDAGDRAPAEAGARVPTVAPARRPRGSRARSTGSTPNC